MFGFIVFGLFIIVFPPLMIWPEVKKTWIEATGYSKKRKVKNCIGVLIGIFMFLWFIGLILSHWVELFVQLLKF